MNIPSHLLIPFSAQRVVDAYVFWSSEHDEQALLDAYAYVIPNGETFTDLVLDPLQKKTFHAERYGGIGTALNGGGARVGLSDTYQVKGIGRTPVAGATAEQWYSYGALTLTDAIHEAINCHLVNALLPHGAVDIIGIIVTGNHSALAETDTPENLSTRFGKGALLVRHNSIRPAHFIPCEDYMSIIDLPYSELSRVKSLVRDWRAQFTCEEDIISWMSECVIRFARQMTKARVCRLYHGAPSSSNFTIDGTWLDLTNTSFSLSGHNQGYPYKWLDDVDIEPLTFEPWFYFLCKYSRLDLNVSTFSKYYREAVSHYEPIYALSVIGIDIAEWPNEIIQSIATPIARRVTDILYTPNQSEEADVWDLPLANFILNIFTQTLHPDHQLLMRLLKELALDIHISLITALRRCLMVSLFEKKHVKRTLAENSMTLADHQQTMQNYINCSAWAFEHSDVVLRHDGLEIKVNNYGQGYYLSQHQHTELVISLDRLLSISDIPIFFHPYLTEFHRFRESLSC